MELAVLAVRIVALEALEFVLSPSVVAIVVSCQEVRSFRLRMVLHHHIDLVKGMLLEGAVCRIIL